MALTPEEWVRQHVVEFLISEKAVPAGMISVEKKVTVNGMPRRTDVAVYAPSGAILLIVECKSPEVALGQSTLNQAAAYNLPLKAAFLLVTNGLSLYICRTDRENGTLTPLQELPSYREMQLL